MKGVIPAPPARLGDYVMKVNFSDLAGLPNTLAPGAIINLIAQSRYAWGRDVIGVAVYNMYVEVFVYWQDEGSDGTQTKICIKNASEREATLTWALVKIIHTGGLVGVTFGGID